MGLLLYQRSMLKAAADHAAEEGAALLMSSCDDMETGMVALAGLDKRRLYRRLSWSNQDQQLEKIRKETKVLTEHGILLHAVSGNIDVRVVDHLISKSLVVSISNRYRLPMAALLEIFQGSGELTIRVSSTVALNESAEIIRNVDYLIDIESQMEKQDPGLKKFGDKAREIMNGLKDKLADFMD